VLAQPPVAPIVEETPPPRRLVAPPPDYPLAARRDGVEGWVVLNLTVAADGHVADAAVTDAEPRDAFEAAALVAVRQWRYSAGDAPTEVRERLVFKLH
jgi:protein TonB